MIQHLESPESSSPIVTRAVAAGLEGKDFDVYHFTKWQSLALHLLGYLPQDAGRFVISRFEALSSISPRYVQNLSIDRLIHERLNDYDHTRGPFPAIVVGAGLGGATAHISLAVNAPFLPQAFVLTLRGGAKDGDINTYLQRSENLAQQITNINPNIVAIQHYDPVHDGWMTRYVNHLRFKLIDLPQRYIQFIRENLPKDGVIYYLNCQANWLRYRISERCYFQVGGWGDITPEEFLVGSERLVDYCRKTGLNRYQWKLEGYPLEQGPESEWGSEPGLESALQRFCAAEGYQFTSITLPGPLDFSHLAFRMVRKRLEKEGREPEGTLIEMFSQFDSTSVIRSGLLPLWLVFNTWDNIKFLQEVVGEFPLEKPTFFSPLSTFSLTPDIVPLEEWYEIFKSHRLINIGARPGHYPADAWALLNWSEPLRKWVTEHTNPITTYLEPEEVLSIIHQTRSKSSSLNN